MAILKVARLGHPLLRRPAEPVSTEELARPETQRLIDDMVETMYEYAGVGLAAPQVHVSRRLAVLEVRPDPRAPELPAVPLTTLVNPVLTPLDGELEEDWEGCLSVPDLRGLTPRYRAVRLEALDRRGARLELVAEGFFARVLQHEVDHLEGRVYLDRMRDLSSLSFREEWLRYGARSGGRP